MGFSGRSGGFLSRFANKSVGSRRHSFVFACPACQRPIEIRKTDAGGTLECHHCTAAISAPDEAGTRPSRILDPRLEASQQHQKQFGQRLVDLKRGRLQTNQEHKARRAGATKGNSSPAPPPPDPSTTAPPPHAPHADGPGPHPFRKASAPIKPNHPAPPDPASPNGKPSPPFSPSVSSPPKSDTAAKPPPRQFVKALSEDQLAKSFTPMEEVRVLPSSEGDPLEWDSTHPPTEGHGNDARGGRHPSPWTLVQSALAAAAVVVLVVWLVQRDLSSHSDSVEQVQKISKERKERHQEQLLSYQDRKREVTEAFDVAAQTLMRDSWQDALPYMRHATRVAPLMQSYYASFHWQPRHLEEVLAEEFRSIEGHEFVALSVRDSNQFTLSVGLEKTDAGWKLDWETLVPVHEIEWRTFTHEQPQEPRELRVSLIRRTPSREQLLLSGVPEDNAFGVMIWCTDIAENSLHAVLEKDSEVARALAKHIGFDSGKRMIVRLAYMPASGGLRDDMVTIDRVILKGWTYLDEDSAADSPVEVTSTSR